MDRIEALAKHLGCETDEITQESWANEMQFCHGKEEYLVLTDEEADQACREEIDLTVWAFNRSFLASHAREGIDEKCFELLQDRCEAGNEAIKSLIKDFDHFVDDAIASDGRGHFLSRYDGEERESGNYYIYRTN